MAKNGVSRYSAIPLIGGKRQSVNVLANAVRYAGSGGVQSGGAATTAKVAGSGGGGGSFLFQDDFSSGSMAGAQNGASWESSANAIITDSGGGTANALRLRFPAASMGNDSFAEQRLNVPQCQELWVRFLLKIPTNYYHRDDTVDHTNNNKFLAFYGAPYEDLPVGFQVNISTDKTGSNGESKLILHYFYLGSEQSPIDDLGVLLLGVADKGVYREFITRVKCATGVGSANGIVQIWKDGVRICNVTNMNSYANVRRFISQIYFPGWANSGFTAQTDFLYKGVQIATSNQWGVS